MGAGGVSSCVGRGAFGFFVFASDASAAPGRGVRAFVDPLCGHGGGGSEGGLGLGGGGRARCFGGSAAGARSAVGGPAPFGVWCVWCAPGRAPKMERKGGRGVLGARVLGAPPGVGTIAHDWREHSCTTAGLGVLTVARPRLRRYLLPPMFTARTKIVKDRVDQEPTELEDDVAKALFELQEQVGAPT